VFCYNVNKPQEEPDALPLGYVEKTRRRQLCKTYWYMPPKEYQCMPTGARNLGIKDHAIDVFTIRALFSTVTNVNFDPAVLKQLVFQAAEMRDRAGKCMKMRTNAPALTPEALSGPATWTPGEGVESSGCAR